MSNPCAVLLSLVVLPVWITAGFADWYLHRRSRIQDTSGTAESLFHLGLFGIVSLGAVAVAVLQVNALVLMLLSAVFAVHQLITWIELRWVIGRRFVSPTEQMIHSFLELLPLAVILMLMIDLATTSPADFREWVFRLRTGLRVEPLLVGAGAVVLFNLVPLAEEVLRCRSTAPRLTRGEFDMPKLWR